VSEIIFFLGLLLVSARSPEGRFEAKPALLRELGGGASPLDDTGELLGARSGDEAVRVDREERAPAAASLGTEPTAPSGAVTAPLDAVMDDSIGGSMTAGADGRLDGRKSLDGED
jgi:hypothetical protein